MNKRTLTVILALGLVVAIGLGADHMMTTGQNITAAAKALADSFDDAQAELAMMDYDAEARVDWHFIPKPHRKGLMFRDMLDHQRRHALRLLRATLSQIGYDKARTIMELESVLHALKEYPNRGNVRDPLRYYFTFFGKPTDDGKWGLSIEGHHLSLNFVIEDGKLVSHTPMFFAANPTVVTKDMGVGPVEGTRAQAGEELQAFLLLAALDGEQKETAIIAPEAPREIRGPADAQPPLAAPVGVRWADLNTTQKILLRDLIKVYTDNVPMPIALRRWHEIQEAGLDEIHFAWAGSQEPGAPHYYRIQGPTFLIEYVNTQPDAYGNPASHIHAVWRDVRGDFGIPIR